MKAGLPLSKTTVITRIGRFLRKAGYAKNTIDVYLQDIASIIENDSFERSDIEHWLRVKYEKSTLSGFYRRLAAANVLCHNLGYSPFLVKDIAGEISPIAKRVSFPQKKLPPVRITCESDSPISIRNTLIARILVDTGLTLERICSLRLSDVSDGGSRIGNISLKDETTDILRSYIKTYRYKIRLHGIDTDYLFVSRKGSQLNRKSVWKIFQAKRLPKPRTLRQMGRDQIEHNLNTNSEKASST